MARFLVLACADPRDSWVSEAALTGRELFERQRLVPGSRLPKKSTDDKPQSLVVLVL